MDNHLTFSDRFQFKLFSVNRPINTLQILWHNVSCASDFIYKSFIGPYLSYGVVTFYKPNNAKFLNLIESAHNNTALAITEVRRDALRKN